MSRHELILPELGIDDVPITLSLWLLRQGCRVRAGDRVAEILAGPVTVDLSAEVDGVLVETLVDEDEPLSVGRSLAVIETSGAIPGQPRRQGDSPGDETL